MVIGADLGLYCLQIITLDMLITITTMLFWFLFEKPRKSIFLRKSFSAFTKRLIKHQPIFAKYLHMHAIIALLTQMCQLICKHQHVECPRFMSLHSNGNQWHTKYSMNSSALTLHFNKCFFGCIFIIIARFPQG